MSRPVFILWQFNGDNASWCNYNCSYCYNQVYGPPRRNKHEWNGDIDKWTRAFERLNRDIYFNLSYGEPMGSNGFYDVLEMIGTHLNWECSLITNLSYPPEQMLETKLAKDRRLYVHATWHPEQGNWEKFQEHLLTLQKANIPLMVLYVFFPPQIEKWREYFPWFDAHNIRTYTRKWQGVYEGKLYPDSYKPSDMDFLKAQSTKLTTAYNLKKKNPKGRPCTAGKDLILVKSDGEVAFCADAVNHIFGNIFDSNYRLSGIVRPCPTWTCGGNYGLLHMEDPELGAKPRELWHDCFLAQRENITGGGKETVKYANRPEMLKWLNGEV